MDMPAAPFGTEMAEASARQLDTSTDLDRLTTVLDRGRYRPAYSSLFECPRHFGAKRSGWHGGAIHERHCSFGWFVRALFDLNLLRIALRLHFLVLKPVAR